MEFSAEQLNAIIDKWIVGNYAERNRKILKRRLIDGICFEPLGVEFNLTPRQIQNIVRKGKQVLIKHLY